MAAHRYWRIYFLATQASDGYSGISGVEMAESTGGSNVCSGGTAEASTPIQAGSASDVFTAPGVGSILQWGGNGYQQWVGYDFGAGNDKAITEVRLWANRDYAPRMASDFIVQYSDDNATWSSAWLGYYASWVIGTMETFNLPAGGAQQIWRLRAQTTQIFADMTVAELAMKSAPGGSNLCSGGTPSARTTYSSFVPAYAFDGNIMTEWSGADSDPGTSWLAYDFGGGITHDIVEIDYTSWSDGFYYQQAPTLGWLESSPDGRNYLPRWFFNATWSSPLQTQTFSAPPSGGGIQASQLFGTSVTADVPPIQASQGFLTVATVDTPPIQLSQLFATIVITEGLTYVPFGDPIPLNCWQPCNSVAWPSLSLEDMANGVTLGVE